MNGLVQYGLTYMSVHIEPSHSSVDATRDATPLAVLFGLCSRLGLTGTTELGHDSGDSDAADALGV